MKKWKKQFSQKKFSHPKNKVHNKGFDKLKVKCYNCKKKGHYAKECKSKRGKGRNHAYNATEYGTTQKNASEENETRREYYLFLSISGSITRNVETWLVENVASKHMTGYKCAITNMNAKNFTCKVELGDNATYSSQGVQYTSV